MTSPVELSRPVIAGNWKMHKGPTEARAFARDLTTRVPAGDHPTVILFPPALSIAAALDELRGRPDLMLGIQNIHWEITGAFTGEITAEMARDAGARFILAGHSERRHIFGETDDQVALKAAAALRADMVAVVCVGETLEERRAGQLELVLARQLDPVLDILGGNAVHLLLAYEPVWAIGTGVNASPADATAAHGLLRERLASRLGSVADRTPILYGGSVKPTNAPELLAAEHVDGVLVGGASLDPDDFASIVAAAGAAR